MDQGNNRTESKYERLRKIGIGSYGVVFKCVNRLTGQIVAIKRYSENDSDPIIRKIAMREVRMLRQLKHPNLIYLIEVFRRKRRLHLVFDYCELTVLDVIEKYGNSCPLNLIRKIVWQIVNGINYCHSHNCIHRDIKPENILINQSGVVKLCDFGFARTLNKYNGRLATQNSSLSTKMVQLTRDGQELNSAGKNKENDLNATSQATNNQELAKSERQALTEYVATRWYRAPELLIGEIYYDIKIDIWAIGCVTAELMRGEPIWPGKTDLDQLFIIKSSLGQLTESQTHTLLTQGIYDHMSIERLLEHKPSQNNSLDRKLPPRVCNGGIDFVSTCLQMDPSKRPTSEELLRHNYIYSSKMNQFMKEASNSNNGTHFSVERASIQGSETENTRTQLGALQAPRSNSQTLALVTAQQEVAISTQKRGSITHPSSKKLVITNEQKPQQLPIPDRIDSSESRYKRKQPAIKSTTNPKTKPSTKVERKSLVPIPRDHGRENIGSSSINKASQVSDTHNKVTNNKAHAGHNRDSKATNIGCISITSQSTDKTREKKSIDPNNKTTQSKRYINNKASATGNQLKVVQDISENDTSQPRSRFNVDSSASSTLSDTTSFLPSLFKADDPRKAKYSSRRKAN